MKQSDQPRVWGCALVAVMWSGSGQIGVRSLLPLPGLGSRSALSEVSRAAGADLFRIHGGRQRPRAAKLWFSEIRFNLWEQVAARGRARGRSSVEGWKEGE